MKYTSTLFAGLLFWAFSSTINAQYLYPYETKVDSIDIVHYDIHLDITDFTTFQLYANTRVHFKPRVNGIQYIDLDLIGLTVDSIKDAAGNLLTSTNYTLGKRVNLGTTYNVGDSTWLEFYYHGHPLSDPNFGGFYFTSAYAYAVGIDIDDVPHNNGKTWFPCFDNFIEKSTFDFYLTIPNDKLSSACGSLISTTFNPDSTKTDHWHLGFQNPTYLTSVCVSNYTKLTRYFTNYLGDSIPVYFWARPADTNAVIGSFTNLEYAFDLLEDKYGPYVFDHIGYSMVPLPGGAMEHTMNVAYPIGLVNGATTYQSVIIHELAHHWFSNNITPRTAEDIWMKEAFAVYGEYLFLENFNNRATYDNTVRNTHKQLLWTCHYDDNGYWPLSGIPQQYVYGTATYDKSADIVHTLRSYLGDSIFFYGVKELVIQDAFKSIDAIEMRDDLSAIIGQDLTDFFDAWILQGGWPHVSIDSIKAIPAGPNYQVNVYLKQKLVGRSNYSNNIPVTLTLRDNNWNNFEQTIQSSGSNNMVTVTVPFLPTTAYLNRDEKISHAVTGVYKTVTTSGLNTLQHAMMNVTVNSVTDSALLVIEHNWAAPDSVEDWTLGYTISPQRYWRVDGIWPAGSNFSATITYNGRLTGTNSRLDNLLFVGTASEDSLVLLYRPDTHTEWSEYPSYTKTMGTTTDKVGNIAIQNLQKGYYTFAMRGQMIGLETQQDPAKGRIFPNPAEDMVNIECTTPYDQLRICNMFGQEVFSRNSYAPFVQVDLSGLSKGVYMVSAYSTNTLVFSKKLIIQ